MQFGEIVDMCLILGSLGLFKTFDICQKTKYHESTDTLRIIGKNFAQKNL
jgi:hypothetical protein